MVDELPADGGAQRNPCLCQGIKELVAYKSGTSPGTSRADESYRGHSSWPCSGTVSRPDLLLQHGPCTEHLGAESQATNALS